MILSVPIRQLISLTLERGTIGWNSWQGIGRPTGATYGCCPGTRFSSPSRGGDLELQSVDSSCKVDYW